MPHEQLSAAPARTADVDLPAAILWDMDGTLVDTEPYWIGAEIALAAEHGGSWTHEQALQLIGRPLTDSASILREQAGIRGTNEEIADTLVGRVAERVRVDGPPWRAGSRELLAAARAAGIPCALVTMSYSLLSEAVLAHLPAGTFDVVVSGDEVSRGKPDPEPYLLAAARLGVDAARCVALEDSVPGVASAEAAGVTTVAVPLMVEIPPAPGRSRVRDVTGLTVADLCRAHAGEVLERV
ncbi:HAD family hydrolase [Georgenia wangjunii]|uniref:HAD family hydrolase n=1 Tax=Georgenia wangjunii TaxID=3117730 RepID=UPI002F26A38D